MKWLISGAQSERLLVPGFNILDVEVEAETPVAAGKEDFVDPAIVSYGRNATSAVKVGQYSQPNGTLSSNAEAAVKAQSAVETLHKPDNATSRPSIALPADPQASPRRSGITENQENIPPSATLTAPFNHLSLDGNGQRRANGHGQSEFQNHLGKALFWTYIVGSYFENAKSEIC